MGLFVLSDGRVRLGWRILLFLLLTLCGTVGLSMVIPGGMPYGAVPILAGSLVGGWVLLGMEGRTPGALGFYVDPGAVREASMGLGLGITVALAVAVLMVASGVLRWSTDPGGGVSDYFRVAGSSFWLFTLPAAGEEAFMRGYLLQALAEAWGGLWALGITSSLFGLLHVGNPHTSWIGLANILLAGLFLGVVYLKTASLWWATGAHLGWNWTHGFLSDLPVSGLELVDTPLFDPVTQGPEWLSGGSFGPEGSVLATLVLAGTTAVLWRTSWLRPGRRAREVRPLFLFEGAEAPIGAGMGIRTIGDFGRKK